MSERLTPEQQREMRVRMGSEVQGLIESVSGHCPGQLPGHPPGYLPRDPDAIPLDQQLDSVLKQYQDTVIDLMEKTLGVPASIDAQDRMRAAIVEACMWLQQGAPGCALQTLENALKL